VRTLVRFSLSRMLVIPRHVLVGTAVSHRNVYTSSEMMSFREGGKGRYSIVLFICYIIMLIPKTYNKNRLISLPLVIL